MATRATKPETRKTVGLRHKRQRKGEQGRALVPRTSRAGIPNKLSRTAKEDILEVFLRIGGVNEMAKWARKNRGDFYSKIYSRLIPKDVQMSADQGLEDLLTQLAEKRSSSVSPPAVDGGYLDVETTDAD